ncbi:cupin domain-containing protein [Streptomyces sp. t39]|uniref:cupin domain-containing protein n=1 Tax=Streptomyces sp. t39 TaxID=1828156 RepID=UPI0011CDCAEF|nr:cupin domain-containing protein [Streptomyces sp. t39]TXS57387.1 cupin domain-containing protein [Streptomyces sp. t39]
MAQQPVAGVLAAVTELLAGAPDERGGALWRLAPVARQLDANVIRVPPGERVVPHVEPDLDVLLCVLRGSGELTVAGASELLEPGCVAWLPRGTERSLLAGPGGLVHLTAHRRRPGLTIGSTRPSATGRRAGESSPPEGETSAGGGRIDGREGGGDPACLLNRICPACDRPAESSDARYCARCGSRLPD